MKKEDKTIIIEQSKCHHCYCIKKSSAVFTQRFSYDQEDPRNYADHQICCNCSHQVEIEKKTV